MTKGNKRWVVASVALGILAVGLASLRDRGPRSGSDGQAGGAGASGGWHGFRDRDFAPATSGAAGGAAGAGARDPSAGGAARDVGAVMGAWRAAILNHDADTVVTLDRAFADDPRAFGPALLASARGDANERVRAFSTRVLGKLRDVAFVEAFAALLDDASPYVRQNAAWALGELGREEAGREAARRAAGELRRLGKRDAASDVRVAANEALKRLQ